MNVARYSSRADLMVRLSTYLKWRSWQFRAKDVSGIPGLAGQPWPEITVLVRSHNISQSYQCPLTESCWSWTYHQPPTLPVYPIKTSWLEARVVTAGKGGEGGKVLDNLKQRNWSILVVLEVGREPLTWLTQRGGHIDRTTRTPSLSIQPWNLLSD